MIERLVDFPIQFLVENELITDDDIELYRFGTNRLVLFCINIMTTLAIGMLCEMIWESLLFTLAYIPLRRFSGGYHAKTPNRCYFQSILLIFGVLYLIHILPDNSALLVIAILISCKVILKRAPMGSKQRELSGKEIMVFKRKTRTILAIEMILIFIILSVNWRVALCIGMSIVCSAMMLLIGQK